MKLNIANPATGAQKMIEVEDEKKFRIFYEKRMASDVKADGLGDEFKGYVFKITGGNDKQGFPMKQGVLEAKRVRLLLSKGHSCYRSRRTGERKRKSVRGCIVGADIAVLSLAIVKKGEKELAGITNESTPRRLGPKRANKIRKLYGLSKKEDVRRYVIRRTVAKEGKKPKVKAPKIQRLITAERLRRKRVYRATRLARVVKNQKALAEYIKARSDARKAHGQKLEVQGKAILPPQVAAPKAGEGKTGVPPSKKDQAAGKAAKDTGKKAPAPATTAPKAADTTKKTTTAPAPAKAAEPKKAAPATTAPKKSGK